MKTRLLILLAIVCASLSSCYNDEALRSQLEDHEQRISSLETLCKKMNTNITSLQSLVEALQMNDYVTWVAPVMEGGKEVGYTITFSSSNSITIYHGKDGAAGAPGQDGADGEDGADGKDGWTPVIGVKQDADGKYYWTLDGEWLLDENGSKIPTTGADGKDGAPGQDGADGAPGQDGSDGKDGADGEDGKDGQDGVDGKDGVTPELKIEDDYWYVTYDGGQTWHQLGKATGENGVDGKDGQDGDAFFEGVDTSDPDYVVLTLIDGTVIKIPTWKAFEESQKKVSLELDVEDYEAGVVPGEVIVINYTLSNVTEETVLTASSDGKYTVRVEKSSDTKGKILVTAPRSYTDGYVNVMVSDGEGYSFIRVVNFYESEISLPNGYQYGVPTEGGELTIPLATNIGYEVQTSDSWLTVEKVETKATLQNHTLKVSVAKNDNSYARTGKIRLYYDHTDNQLFEEIIINQSSAYFTIDRTHYVVPFDGETYTLNVTSSRGLSFLVPETVDWLTVTDASEASATAHQLTITASANETDKKRSTEISLYDQSGSMLLGTLNIIQLNDTSDGVNDPADMIFEVRANFANYFTAQLPLYSGGQYKLDCFVDWGDGTVEHITTSNPTHIYEGLDMGQVFEIRVSGTVERLYGSCNVISVKQWGNTGLKSMNRAFDDCATLQSIVGDETGSLSEVTNFSFTFYGCSGLTSIPVDLFSYCPNVTSFSSTFDGCSGLTSIPVDLFSNCPNVTSFSSTFDGCSGLTSIPSDLFSYCPNVTSFRGTFDGCSGLTSIPVDLFSYCPNVTSFDDTFSGCSDLTSIPVDLFSNCPNVTSFRGTFGGCFGLTSIPTGLFDNNRKVTDFARCFSSFRNLSCESPYTVIDGAKVHLYERENYPDYFVAPTSYSGCFESGSYTDEIPSSWRVF